MVAGLSTPQTREEGDAALVEDTRKLDRFDIASIGMHEVLAPAVIALAKAEGLEAHGRSVSIRLNVQG